MAKIFRSILIDPALDLIHLTHLNSNLPCFQPAFIPTHSRDKLNNLVLFDKGTYDKLYKEVPTYKLITPSIVSERLKVNNCNSRKST